MDIQEILATIKNPEKETIELKNSFSEWEEICKTIAAFSTRKGGNIFVGINRNGCPIGTRCNNETTGKLQGVANIEIKPSASISVELINFDSAKELIIAKINIKKGNGVFSYKGVHYERRGDTNHPLTAEEIFELQKDIKKLYFDEMPSSSEERPALITDIDEDKVKSYLSQVKKIKDVFDIRRFLSNNHFLVNGGQQVKNGAIMIFGKEPQKFIPQLKLSLSIFPSTEITDRFIKKEFVGDIFEIFDRTYLEIQKNINIYSFVDGKQRIDIPEYPLEVIRECLVNSIVHRDYFDRNVETYIKIFKNRIEIVNPASFPFENVTFDEIKKTKLSKRRNILIADFFESVGLMEKEGRGITKIEEGMKNHKLPLPLFEVAPKTFMVILKNVEDKSLLKESLYKKVVDFGEINDRQSIIIQFLKEEQIKSNKPRHISRREYVKIITEKGITITNITASRDLQELTSKNIFTKTGEKSGTIYFLT